MTWEHRRLGFRHYLYLWGSLGIALPTLVTGDRPIAAPLAILVGSLLGAGLLALMGSAGSDTGVPTTVLLRPALGVRGSYLAAAIIAVYLIVWGALSVATVAQAADAVTRRLSGESAADFWLPAVGMFSLVLAVIGPVGVTRHWLEKFAVWCLLGGAAWLTYAAIVSPRGGPWRLRAGFSGDYMSFWKGVDGAVAMYAGGWLPLVADCSRFAASGRRAARGTGCGFLLGNLWHVGLGLLLISYGKVGEPAAAMATLAGSGVTLLLIVVGGSAWAFTGIYSAALSMNALFRRVPLRWLATGVGLGCVLLATRVPVVGHGWSYGVVSMMEIGSIVFLPLAGLVAADYYLVARRWYELEELFRPHGAYWFAGGFHWQGFLAWGAGLLTAFTLGELGAKIGSSLPGFVVAFAVHALLVRRRRRQATEAGGGTP